MRRGILGTAAVLTALAAPAPALARDWTVRSGQGSCTTADPTCPTVTAAAAAVSDDDRVFIEPGTYAESPTFSKADLTVAGTGNGRATIRGTLTFGAPVSSETSGPTVQRLAVVPQSGNTNALVIQSVAASRKALIESTILAAAESGADLVGNGVSAMTTTITARHVTAWGGSAATSLSSGSMVTFFDSIVGGTQASGTTAGSSNTTNSDPTQLAGLFASTDRTSGQFLQQKSTASTIDQGGDGSSDADKTDVDGRARPAGPAWDRGASEFYDTPPTAPAVAANPQSAYPGDQIAFTASGATDSDPDGSVVSYFWSFGDGTTQTAAPGVTVTHSYTTPAFYDVTAQAIDNNGQAGAAGHVQVGIYSRPAPLVGPGGSVPIGPLPRLGSAASAGSPTDNQPPAVSISVPRRGQRLRIGRTVPTLRGRVADDSGVLSVELALARRRGASCAWFDGRRSFRSGSCGRPTWFRAVVDDFAWYYEFPHGVRPRTGTYLLSVRATDIRHNRTAPTASAASTATFRFAS